MNSSDSSRAVLLQRVVAALAVDRVRAVARAVDDGVVARSEEDGCRRRRRPRTRSASSPAEMSSAPGPPITTSAPAPVSIVVASRQQRLDPHLVVAPARLDAIFVKVERSNGVGRSVGAVVEFSVLGRRRRTSHVGRGVAGDGQRVARRRWTRRRRAPRWGTRRSRVQGEQESEHLAILLTSRRHA